MRMYVTRMTTVSHGRVAPRSGEILLRPREVVEAFSMKGASSSSILLDISLPPLSIALSDFNFANMRNSPRDLTSHDALSKDNRALKVHTRASAVAEACSFTLTVDLPKMGSLRVQLVPERNVASDVHDPPNTLPNGCNVDQSGVMR